MKWEHKSKFYIAGGGALEGACKTYMVIHSFVETPK